jgi:uridine kinase
MSTETIELELDEQTVEESLGVTPLDIYRRHNHRDTSDNNPIVGASWSNRMVSMRHPLDHSGRLDFIRYQDRYGRYFYRRGVQLVMGLAVKRAFPDEHLQVGHSLEHGYYYEFKGWDSVPRDTLDTITAEMDEIVRENLPINVEIVDHDRALELFEERDCPDKVRLIEHWNIEEIQLHKIGDFYDIAYFPAVGASGITTNYELRSYMPGFILRFPSHNDMTRIPEAEDQPKLFQIYQETQKWAKVLDVDDVGSLNKIISRGDVGEFIKISEAFHEKKISRIADAIKERFDDTNVIAIAGPSSSGKTTFSKRLSTQLRINGIDSVKLSTDDYFVEREETPLDEDGNYNFESIEALDLELFNDHLERLLRGETVEIPEFSFEEGTRKDKTTPLQVDDEQLIIIEGIHGLNPRLTEALPRHRKYLIYVSALTQLVIDEQNRISTSDSRLIRRIVRDMLFRDIDPETNINRWPSVRRGEQTWIFPFQERADVMFNSALLYELGALRPYIVPALEQIDDTNPAYRTAHRMRRFADLFQTIDSQEIPPTSILREFIGGSSFDY